ncbi:wax ester/triacylglycerol synthase domain-containing protein [Streptomyces sp. NPDC003011]
MRLGPADRALLAGPAGQPVPIVALLDFDGPTPSTDGLRTRVAERAEHLPALRYRLGHGATTARWSDRLDAAQHVRVLSAGGGAGHAGAELLLNEGPPAGEDRPPWEIVLMARSGGYSLGFRGHHALYDGVLVSILLRALLDDSPAACPSMPPARRPPMAGVASALTQQVALLRASQPVAAFASPSGHTRRVRYVDVALAYLRELARAHRVSINDIYLTALAHAVYLWQRGQSDGPHPPVATGMPVSYRQTGEEDALGNRMALVQVVLPCDEPSPVQALRHVVAQTARHAGLRQRDALRVMAAYTPGAATTRLIGRLAHPLTASFVATGGALTYRGDVARAAYGLTDILGPNQCYTSLTVFHDTARLSVVHHDQTPIGPHLPDLWRTALRTLEPAADKPDAVQQGAKP